MAHGGNNTPPACTYPRQTIPYHPVVAEIPSRGKNTFSCFASCCTEQLSRIRQEQSPLWFLQRPHQSAVAPVTCPPVLDLPCCLFTGQQPT